MPAAFSQIQKRTFFRHHSPAMDSTSVMRCMSLLKDIPRKRLEGLQRTGGGQAGTKRRKRATLSWLGDCNGQNRRCSPSPRRLRERQVRLGWPALCPLPLSAMAGGSEVGEVTQSNNMFPISSCIQNINGLGGSLGMGRVEGYQVGGRT